MDNAPLPTGATPAAALLPPPATTASTRQPQGRPRPRWRSSDLLGASQEVEIEHGAAVYRLRLTTLGKLILTK